MSVNHYVYKIKDRFTQLYVAGYSDKGLYLEARGRIYGSERQANEICKLFNTHHISDIEKYLYNKYDLEVVKFELVEVKQEPT